MRIGFLQLTDAAPVVLAHELGWFAEEGVDVTLSVEPSWANIADKLAHGFLDAAVVVPPLAFAVTLGLRGRAFRLIVPQALSLGGNTVTLETSLARRVEEQVGSRGQNCIETARGLAAVLRSEPERPALAVVHVYSTHNLLLRYWLAAGGLDPDTEVHLVVIPPAQTAEALSSGRIAGFCAGAPWGAVAERQGVGRTVATSHDIWRNGPEKVLAVSERWVEENPQALHHCLRALLRAAQYCDDPVNAPTVARTLSGDAYLGVDATAIVSSLPPPGPLASAFFRNAATYPWHSHAEWFLRQMARWRLLDDIDFTRTAEQIYRPDFHARAAASLKLSVPCDSRKTENHRVAWQCAADPAPIAMDRDDFCDMLND
jgi:NitT/TauT family transport system ATP-binding protein/nitrate/nitrite transport system substrate-binding protein